jgi:hypothetical protein
MKNRNISNTIQKIISPKVLKFLNDLSLFINNCWIKRMLPNILSYLKYSLYDCKMTEPLMELNLKQYLLPRSPDRRVFRCNRSHYYKQFRVGGTHNRCNMLGNKGLSRNPPWGRIHSASWLDIVRFQLF